MAAAAALANLYWTGCWNTDFCMNFNIMFDYKYYTINMKNTVLIYQCKNYENDWLNKLIVTMNQVLELESLISSQFLIFNFCWIDNLDWYKTSPIFHRYLRLCLNINIVTLSWSWYFLLYSLFKFRFSSFFTKSSCPHIRNSWVTWF